MNYLLDTCVISEMIKSNPNRNVINWITSCQENSFYLSVLTIGEIQKGISKLSESKRKNELQSWIDNELRERFSGRILDINTEVAKVWGKIQGNSEKQGITIPAIDLLIAATGIFYGLIVVTRNIVDMENTSVSLLNPWK
ncbi:MAG: type II toxin-antitoxin system VapC family toxin [bacterium]